MSRIIITDGVVFDGREIIPRATIVVEGETITSIITDSASGESARYTRSAEPGDVVINAAGKLVTPGLVNAHTHIYSALARGITLKDEPPVNFVEILKRLWWRLDQALTLEDIRLSAHLHAVECLKNGVTTIFDHHASMTNVRGSLPVIAGALADHGLRSCLSFEVSDRRGAEITAAGIAENMAFINDIAARGGASLCAKFGLHASMTLSDETLRACADSSGALAAGIHIHVAEDQADQDDARERGQSSVISRLHEFGLLNENSLCVHGVHLSPEELAILSSTGASLVHCPESNMNNAVGAASLSTYQAAGVKLLLGTDGFTADMTRESLVAHLLQSHLHQDPGAGYSVVPDLLFNANARFASDTFGLGLGCLSESGPADVVVWSYYPPTPFDAASLYGHLMFGLVDARANDVIIAGNYLLRDGLTITCDEMELTSLCSEAAMHLWERF